MSASASIETAATAAPVASGRLTIGIGVVGASVCLLAVGFVATSAPADEAVARGLIELLITGVPIAAGLYAIRSRSNVRFGFMLLAVGFGWSLAALGESSHSLAYSIGRLAAWLMFPSLLYLMLAFPEGRIRAGLDRSLLRALTLLLVVLFVGSAPFVDAYPTHTPFATCDADCPPNAFLAVEAEPDVMQAVVEPVRELIAVALLAGVLVSLARRWRAATPLQRRSTWPVMLMILLSTVVLATFLLARRLGPDAPAVETLGLLWGVCVAGIAAAFFAALVQRRVLVGQVLTRLAASLSEGLDVARMRAALASALGDPTLEVLVPDGPVRWRDSGGRPTRLPRGGAGRGVTIIRDQTTPAVALVHDADLGDDEELLAAVGSLVLGSVRHDAVTARLGAALQQLQQSRQRIAEAADLERARIERDLHDGAQQRLMALRIRLSLAEELLQTDPLAGADAVHELGAEVDETLDELRSLAHGVYPAVLHDRGLAEALRDLAARAPLPIHLHTTGVTQQSMQVETAVYFTCLEAVQNAIKHAPTASGVWIALDQGDMLTLEVRDDGPGFVPPRVNGADRSHVGLRNMRDRLEAVGGRLLVDASPGHGTRIIGLVPLAGRPGFSAGST